MAPPSFVVMLQRFEAGGHLLVERPARQQVAGELARW